MFLKVKLLVFPCSLAVLAAGEQTWKDKQIAEWTEDEAKQVLADSPWAKTVTPTLDRSRQNERGRGEGGIGRGGGIGIGGIGLGIPGIGIGRRGGMGYPRTGGGGYPGGGQPRDPGNGPAERNTGSPEITLRWESAVPVRGAELKVHDASAPTVDEQHYAIAVYGLPRRAASGDAKALEGQLRKEAALKRAGKKDLKPSSVEVQRREDGPVILYLFPRSTEITRQDQRVQFDARIGRFQFTQSFYTDDMVYQGKLEL